MPRSKISISIATLALMSTLCFIAAPLITHAEPVVNPDSTFQNGLLTDPNHPNQPLCDPNSTDLSAGGAGCGLDDGLQLIYNVIKYISIVIIPIAVLLLGYAGFTMMTSAGNSEKMSQAKHTIQLVVVGLVIIFMSAFIVRYVFIALNSSFRPK